MGRPSKYPPELRRRAIAEVIERDRKIPEVARELGLGSPRRRCGTGSSKPAVTLGGIHRCAQPVDSAMSMVPLLVGHLPTHAGLEVGPTPSLRISAISSATIACAFATFGLSTRRHHLPVRQRPETTRSERRPPVRPGHLDDGTVEKTVEIGPDSRRPRSEKWGLTCDFDGGGGRI